MKFFIRLTIESLNAPTGAWCSLTTSPGLPGHPGQRSQCTYRCVVLPDGLAHRPSCVVRRRLNAPTGAWCSLTGAHRERSVRHRRGLNAPTGAWCSLTCGSCHYGGGTSCLNAPTGAWCSLTWLGRERRTLPSCLNAPTGAWCSLTPASESGGMTPLRGPGAPPAPGAPLRTGQHRS